MHGQRTLGNLVTLQALAKAMTGTNPTLGPAQSEETGAALWAAAEEEWRQLWSGLLTTLLTERDGTLLELKTLQTLSDRALGKEAVISRIPTVARALLRLLGCIKLERMMEERTLADYRAEVESCIRLGNEEAETWLPLAAPLALQLQQLEGTLEGITKGIGRGPNGHAAWSENLAASLATIREALIQSIGRLQILQSEFGEPAKEIALVSDLAPMWKKVDRTFGTWVRRLEPAVRLAASGALLALSAYLLIGMFIPTPLILWFALAGALAAAVARYLRTRSMLTDEITRLHEKYSRELKPYSGEFWRENSKPGFIKRIVAQKSDPGALPDDSPLNEGKAGPSKKLHPLVMVAIACLVVYAIWAAAGASGASSPPHFKAFVSPTTSGSTCWIARGMVLWAGPGRVVMLEDQGGHNILTVVNHESIAGLSVDQTMDACIEKQATRIETPAQLPAEPLGILRMPKAILIPFPGPVAGGCNGKYQGLGASLNASARETLEMIAAAIQKCHPEGLVGERPPAIDVMGFASDKEFACGAKANQLEVNLGLAEHRRRLVLEALGASYAEQDGKWRSQNFQIVHDEWTRWRGLHQRMNERLLYEHQNDPIARYVAIEVSHSGACTRPQAI